MRSYREFWLWLGAAALALATALVAIALAYFTKESKYPLYTSWQMIAAYVTFLAAFVSFGAVIKGTAFPPWATPNFPNLNIEIYAVLDMKVNKVLPNGMRVPTTLQGYQVRITNLETEQNASLSVTAFLRYIPGSAGRVGEEVGSDLANTVEPPLPFTPISNNNPITLAPATTVGGWLIYEFAFYGLRGRYVSPQETRLNIWDHITNSRMDIITTGIGNFGRSEMTVGKRGFQVLGPEHEPRRPEPTSAETEIPETDVSERKGENSKDDS